MYFLKIFISIFSFVFLLTLPSYGYYSTLDTGEIISLGKYRILAEPQYIFGNSGGFNFVGHFDAGLDSASNIRVTAGVGAVNFQLGSFYKWIPFPDTENQPALGIRGGVIFDRDFGINTLSVRVHPLISKDFRMQDFILTAYGSTPFGMAFSQGSSLFTLQLALGSEIKFDSLPDWSFMSEFGINIANAFSYISFAGVFHFEED